LRKKGGKGGAVTNQMPAIDIRRDNEKILSAHLDSYLLLEFHGKKKSQFF
jgi:hypothetical protein